MEPEISWIDSAARFEERLAGIGAGPLCVDTEGDSLHHYPEKICLIQLSFGGRDLLVDPLAGIDLGALAGPLRDPTLRKIFHGADYDLRVLHRDLGHEVRGLFDTMLVARLVGERAFGLAALLEKHLDVRLDKRLQRADWSLRPLSLAMQRYAALDTHWLGPLVEILERQLHELGRAAWAEEEFRRLESVRWEREESDEAFLRIKGSSRLDGRQLAVLRELHRMREQIAVKRDRPPFKVLSNAALLALAARPPGNRKALEAIADVPRSWTRGDGATRLMEAVGTAVELPGSELPAPRARTRRRRSTAFEAEIKALGKRRDALAVALDIEPSVLAPRGLLEQLIDRRESGEPVEEVPELRRWQLELLRPLLG